MDPVSLIVMCFALYGILQRAPQLAGEAVREFQSALRGETSPRAAARRARLVSLGIDPAVGGAARQFAGNAWRDMWLDLDEKRTVNRNRRLAGERPSGGGWRDRVDAEIGRRADRWRTRTLEPDQVADETQPNQATPPSEPPVEPPAEPWPHEEEPPWKPGPDVEPPPAQPYQPQPDPREPIRVIATLGQPTRNAVAILEGEPMSNAVQQQTVSGVVSGAAEARSIERAMEAAKGAYQAQLAQITKRIHSLAEQTVTTVGMRTSSRVVAGLSGAAEAAASAQADAAGTAAEVGPALRAAAKEFEKLNS